MRRNACGAALHPLERERQPRNGGKTVLARPDVQTHCAVSPLRERRGAVREQSLQRAIFHYSGFHLALLSAARSQSRCIAKQHRSNPESDRLSVERRIEQREVGHARAKLVSVPAAPVAILRRHGGGGERMEQRASGSEFWWKLLRRAEQLVHHERNFGEAVAWRNRYHLGVSQRAVDAPLVSTARVRVGQRAVQDSRRDDVRCTHLDAPLKPALERARVLR